MKVSKKVLSKRIIEARQRLHLSRRYVADYLGVSESYIQLIESGKRRPSRKTLIHLAAVIGVLPQELWGKHSFLDYNPQDATAAEELAHFKEATKASLIGN